MLKCITAEPKSHRLSPLGVATCVTFLALNVDSQKEIFFLRLT